MLLTPKNHAAHTRGSALITAVCTISALAAIAALLVSLAISGAETASRREDAARAKLVSEKYFEYGVALIYADTFGRDGVPYNGDDGDEGYDWPDDLFGRWTLKELREGVVVFDGPDESGLRAKVRLRIIDHESLVNINVHGNFYGPGGTTNVGHGASPGEIALERALAAADLPESIFPNREEAREAARKLARQIISSSRFFGLPGYYPGGEHDRIDNHARLDYSADANRTGIAEPNEFSRGLNDFADNTAADSAFPSFLAKGPYQARFGLDTELAIDYARFYPDDPRTSAGRAEDFARDTLAGKLIEKDRLFLHCLRATDGDALKARALFAAVAERVCTFSADADVSADFRRRIYVNDASAENVQALYNVLARCGGINVFEARQVVANLAAYLSSAGGRAANCEFMGLGGLARFPQFSEVYFDDKKKALYIEVANPFRTAPAASGEQDVAIDMRDMEIRVKLKGVNSVFVADLNRDGSVIKRGEPADGRKTVVYRIGPGTKSTVQIDLVPSVTITSPAAIESMELWYKAGVKNPFPNGPIDVIPAFVFESCTGVSRERKDLLASSADRANWAASAASKGQSLLGFTAGEERSFNSVSVMECDAASEPYLEVGGDGNRFANVGEFFRLLAVGPSYNPQTGRPFDSMAQFVAYLGAHREGAKLYERLSEKDKALLYDALTVFAPLPAQHVNAEDAMAREGRINVNTAPRGTLAALPFVSENGDANSIGADEIAAEFSAAPARGRSDLLRLASLNPWRNPLVPPARFPANFAQNPMPRARANHPEEREFVLGVLENFITARSSVFTVLVEVELKDSRGRVAAEARLVGIVDRSRPVRADDEMFYPRLRVMMRHFLDND